MTSDRPVFVVYLQPADSGTDGVRALRALLKAALRQHRLKCIRLTTYDPLEFEAGAQLRVANKRRAHVE